MGPVLSDVQRMQSDLDLTTPEAHARLARLYRYAQVGRCVSSVTHDVNNFLGAILAYVELIELDSTLTPESTRMVQEIVNAVRKSSALVNNLTDVSRRERMDLRMTDSAQLMERVLDLRRYDMKVAQVGLKTDYATSLPTLLIDLPKVEQSLIYLVSNAIENVAGMERRQVHVTVTPSGDGVEFVVFDSGEPVPGENREHIFEPFFTTKEAEHVGLGLTIARETARLHDGDLVYEPDRGFVMRLPKQNSLASKAVG